MLVTGHLAFGGLERSVTEVNEHSHLFHYVIDPRIPGFLPREWLNKMVWRMDATGSRKVLEIVYIDTVHSDFPCKEKYVRASVTARFRFEQLSELEGGLPQTKLIYWVQIDMKGSIPKFLFNARAAETLSFLVHFRKTFSKSREVDAARRITTINKIQLASMGGSEAEAALKKFDELYKTTVGTKRYYSYPLADNWILRSQLKSGKGWGSAEVNVKASLEEAAAFFWNYDSRAYMKVTKDMSRKRSRKESINGTMKQGVKRRIKFKSNRHNFYNDRVFQNVLSLHWLNNDTIVILLMPLNEERRSSSSFIGTGVVRGSMTSAVKLTRYGTGETKVKYAVYLNVESNILGMAKGSRLSSNMVRLQLEAMLEEISGIALYFQRLKPLDFLDKDDGAAIGHDLMYRCHTSRQMIERVDLVMHENLALR